MATNIALANPLDDSRLKGIEIVKTSKVLVTPQIAMDWLTRNKSNRSVKRGVLNNYVKQMLSGQWKDGTGESIKFDDKGRLIDGQHRLQAIINSNKSIWMEVKTDMDWNARKVIDTGAKRIASDLLSMEGYSSPIQLAATARFIIMFKLGKYSYAANQKSQSVNRIFVSNTDILKYVKDNEDLREILKDFQNTWAKSFKYLSVSMMSALYVLFSEKSKRDSDEFFEKLSKGDGLGMTNPIFQLREKLRSSHSAKRKMLMIEKLALCIITWNAFREKKKLPFLVYSENEKFPKPI